MHIEGTQRFSAERDIEMLKFVLRSVGQIRKDRSPMQLPYRVRASISMTDCNNST
jgi:hypothetical protein